MGLKHGQIRLRICILHSLEKAERIEIIVRFLQSFGYSVWSRQLVSNAAFAQAPVCSNTRARMQG